MKKIVSLLVALFAVLMISTNTANAQTAQGQKYFYITVLTAPNGVMSINKGDGRKGKPDLYTVLGEDNKKLKMGSKVAVINYMSQRGWEVEQGENSKKPKNSEIIMKKPVDNFDQQTIDALFGNLKLKKE